MPPIAITRRQILVDALAGASVTYVLSGASAAATAGTGGAPGQSGDPVHDFDFFLGSWNVRHRRLKERLAGNDDWEEFDGTTTVWPLLGGIANIGDSMMTRGGVTYRGIGLRVFDAKTKTWADWWLSSGNPHTIDVPGVGTFVNGVGTFISDDTFNGKPIQVRGMFSRPTPATAQWEQAFSPDGGKTWETNWVMRYTRST